MTEMDVLISRSGSDESYIEMLCPPASPTHFQDTYDIIKYEPSTGLEMWESEHNVALGYFPGCSASLFAVAPHSMQSDDTPMSEPPADIDSTQYHHNHSKEGSLAQNCPRADGIPEMDSWINESTSDYFGIMQTSMSDCLRTPNLDKAENDNNSLPYSQLLYRAFMSLGTRELSLPKIYKWFEENTNKAADNEGKDWRGSIRHNLSMNQAFKKVLLSKEDGKKSRRATGWELADWAVDKGVRSTSKYREVKTGSKWHKARRKARRKARSSYRGSRRAP